MKPLAQGSFASSHGVAIRCLILAVSVVPLACRRAPEAKEVEAARNRFFAAISSYDPDSIRAAATPDIALLEDGLVWSMDSLLSTVTWLEEEGLRIEYAFENDRVRLEGPVAWMTYKNRGILSAEGGADTLHWVESALFREEEGEWKMILLHSTRIEPR